MRWASTGCLVDSSARLIKPASRNFNFRNLVFRILTRRIRDDDGPTQPQPQKSTIKFATKGTKTHKSHQPDIGRGFFLFYVFLCLLWRNLALNDLNVRIELNVEIALANLLI